MSILVKVIMTCVITAFLSSILSKNHPEYTVALIIASSVIILGFLLDSFTLVFESINSYMENAGINPKYIEIILKIIGIAYLSEYSAAVFYDANETAMAKKIELAGKIIIFIIIIPVISSLSDLILSIL